MILVLFAVLGVVLLILAGLSVGAPRIQLGWLGAACIAIVLCWPAFNAVGI